jgi:peroxiredoxin Q/BCP
MEAKLFQMVPDLALEGPDREVRLSQFRDQYLVLYFYPKANTPGCTREAQDFSALLPEFSRLDAVVVGVSRDRRALADRPIPKEVLRWWPCSPSGFPPTRLALTGSPWRNSSATMPSSKKPKRVTGARPVE